MAPDNYVLCVVFLTVPWAFTRGDVVLVCDYMKSCILPCSFNPGDDMVIHWIQVAGNTPVHSYYHNADQLARQNPHFKGRTSLFKDQLSRGNASLLLTGVEVQDRGRYKCYTSTISGNKESFIVLQMTAPVRKVNIQKVENRITCSSEGIYPEPTLTWSALTGQEEPKVQQTEQQLYNISSSLILTDNVTDETYSCTVSTDKSRRTATLFSPTSVSGCKTETTISCTSSNIPHSGLVWTFNHSQIILNQTGTDPYSVSEGWRQQVKGVSESGSLTLQDLSSNQEGIYTCELSTDEETYINQTEITTLNDCSTNSAATTAVLVIVSLLVAIGAVLIFHYRKKIRKRCSKEQKTSSNHVTVKTELNKLNHDGNDS